MPHAGQDEDVDLGVAEDPEQVLEEDRIAAALDDRAPARKKWVPKTRSRKSRSAAEPSTGTKSTLRIAVSQRPQTVSGIRK